MNPYNIIAHVHYSLFRKCSETGWKLDTRTLLDHELVLITGGKGMLITENTTHSLKQGTLLYLSPGFRHSMVSCNDNPLSFYGLHFGYMNATHFNNEWDCREHQDALPSKNISEVAAYQKLESLFKKVNQYWNEKRPGYEMICRGVMLEILYSIMHNSEASYASRCKIETLITYISNNLQDKITVEHLARMANWSPDYLSVQFKTITGLTVIQYINRCRIDKAKIMLLNNELLVKDIASSLGFSDEFYFSKTFKKLEGISPREFRNRS